MARDHLEPFCHLTSLAELRTSPTIIAITVTITAMTIDNGRGSIFARVQYFGARIVALSHG